MVGHIRAGGDLGLICHQEDFILRAYEALVREAERDRKFARRVRESARARAGVQRRKLAGETPAPPLPRPHESRSCRASSGNLAKKSAWLRSLAPRRRRNAHEHDCRRRDERHFGGRNQCGAGAVVCQRHGGRGPVPTRNHATSHFLRTRNIRSLPRFGAQSWE